MLCVRRSNVGLAQPHTIWILTWGVVARRAASSLTAISKGTVNDPTTFPPPSKTHGSYHWAFERLLSAALLPVTAAAFATSGTAYPVLDGLLGISLVMHSHIGVSNVTNRVGYITSLTSRCVVRRHTRRLSPQTQVPYSWSSDDLDA